MARRYLSIPATSAAIEGLFSIATNIITPNRNKLYSETARKILLLKSQNITELEKYNEQITHFSSDNNNTDSENE